MSLSLEIAQIATNVEFRFIDGARQTIAFADVERNPEPQYDQTIGLLASFIQAGTASVEYDALTVGVPIEFLVKLDDEQQEALGLPPPPPYVLQIDALGALGRMSLRTRWYRADGIMAADPAIDGFFMTVEGSRYRLASPLYEIVQAIESFNSIKSPTPAAQADAWATIQSLVMQSPERVTRSGVAERMRVARATHFSLDFVAAQDGGLSISPVPLVGDQALVSSDSLVGDQEPREPTRLLSSADQDKFQRAFQARSEVQSAYLGGRDTYVVLSPHLQKALKVVRRVQDRPASERMAFAQNPYSFLPADSVTDESLFVETRSFSDRVQGLGILEKVTLPWQILQSQGWLPPETVTLTFAGQTISIAPNLIEPAITDIEHAMGFAQPTVSIDGHIISACPETRDAFLEARNFLDQSAAKSINPSTRPTDGEKPDRIGLQIIRNLEEAAYQTKRSQRARLNESFPKISTTLKDHQVEAVKWLQRRWLSGYRGALLADDMGLGKTLSSLAFILWLRSAMLAGDLETKPMLIVAPLSLLENWQAEHKFHVGDNAVRFIDIVPAYGSSLPKARSGREIETGNATLDLERLTQDRFGNPTCVLTTYETLRDYQQSFASVHFGVVILDEAQRIKNPASLSWHAVSGLHSDFWLAMTGTPVENRLADLWAIADVLEPNFLGSLKDFSKSYEAAFDEELLRGLKASLETSEDGAPFMMRRLKEHVLEGLPPKTEHPLMRTMPPVQVAAYSDALSRARSVESPEEMLVTIQRLREISLHPIPIADAIPESYAAASARFTLMFEILDDIAARGEKALIFLDRNAIEAYLARLIQGRYKFDRLPSIINGNVPGSKRKQLVDEFQARAGFDVMLLSPKAGGVGLTITAANHVIHLSRWWNPAVEDQSTDRAYRIGQRKPVHVYQLVATLPDQPGQSFDERLHELLAKKRKLSRDLLWPARSIGDADALLGNAVTII